MIFGIDMDGCLVSSVEGGKYETVKPNQVMINIVNRLFEDGHIIKIYTSRGQTTGIDQKELTEKQLKKFDIKYHELVMGKIHYDILIDDKCLDVSRFIKNYEDLIR